MGCSRLPEAAAPLPSSGEDEVLLTGSWFLALDPEEVAPSPPPPDLDTELLLVDATDR